MRFLFSVIITILLLTVVIGTTAFLWSSSNALDVEYHESGRP